jgi:hypothetical protein
VSDHSTLFPPFAVGDTVEFVHDGGLISGTSSSPYRVVAFDGDMFDCVDANGVDQRFCWLPRATARWRVVPE